MTGLPIQLLIEMRLNFYTNLAMNSAMIFILFAWIILFDRDYLNFDCVCGKTSDYTTYTCRFSLTVIALYGEVTALTRSYGI